MSMDSGLGLTPAWRERPGYFALPYAEIVDINQAEY